VIDIDPSVLRPVLGGVPEGAAPLTAYAGTLAHGRTLASSGNRVVAADMPFGSGAVTLVGFDPTTSWIAKGDTWDTPLWRRLLPQRTGGTVSLTDDSTLVSGAANLPSLALPPTSGLLVLLIGYIVLVGPVNYAVLRWLDRREWAWVTALALIAVFTAGSFGIGALTRGSSVIIHEVAIVRGAAGTDQASVQSWLGIFSPVRASFQLRAPGDTLLSAPISGDMFTTGQTGALDVLEGDPSRIRDLSVGYGSMRTVRAEGSTSGPVVDAELRLEGGRLVGTVVNHSDRAIQAASIVLGSSVQNLGDLAPGATANVNLEVASGNTFNPVQLSDKVVGVMNWNGSGLDEVEQLKIIRRAVIDQLSVDPTTGMGFALPAASAVLLGWGRDPVVPVTLDGQQIRRVSDVLYEVPLRYSVTGNAVFRGDLLPASLLDVNASFFSKDPSTIAFGTGNIVIAYRPVPFDGTFTPDTVTVAMSGGGDPSMPGGQPVAAKETVRCDPATTGCSIPQDSIPDIEVLDVRTGAWVQFAHLTPGQAYTLPDAARWVDPGTGEIQVKFVNETQNQIGFQFPVVLSGAVR
jgi:hypothetical protein